MKRLISLVLVSTLAGAPAFAAEPSPAAPPKLGLAARTKLRIQLAWWKALLFEMHKNDGLLQQFGTGNGFSSRNVVVGAANTALLPLAFTSLQVHKAIRARRLTEARAIVAGFEGSLSGLESNRLLIETGLREATTFKKAAAGRVIVREASRAKWAHRLRYVRRIAVAGLVAAFVFDAGRTWLQIWVDPGTLDKRRGELEKLVDQAELQLMQE